MKRTKAYLAEFEALIDRRLAEGRTDFDTLINPGWDAVLSSEEREAFRFYKGNFYKSINQPLWNDTKPSVFVQSIIDHLQSALKRAVLPQPIIVWRGSYISSRAVLRMFPRRSIVHKAFMSTSLDLEVARSFMKQGGEGRPMVMKLLIEQGSCAGYIHNIPEVIYPETEVLLPYGTKYTILAAHYVTENGTSVRRLDGLVDDNA